MIDLDPEAREEIAEAAEFYEKRRRGLGTGLLAEVDRGIAAIVERPRSFQSLQDAPAGLVLRCALIERFPFALVFLELEGGRLRVVAFAHTKRRPSYWLRRVR